MNEKHKVWTSGVAGLAMFAGSAGLQLDAAHNRREIKGIEWSIEQVSDKVTNSAISIISDTPIKTVVNVICNPEFERLSKQSCSGISDDIQTIADTQSKKLKDGYIASQINSNPELQQLQKKKDWLDTIATFEYLGGAALWLLGGWCGANLGLFYNSRRGMKKKLSGLSPELRIFIQSLSMWQASLEEWKMSTQLDRLFTEWPESFKKYNELPKAFQESLYLFFQNNVDYGDYYCSVRDSIVAHHSIWEKYEEIDPETRTQIEALPIWQEFMEGKSASLRELNKIFVKK